MPKKTHKGASGPSVNFNTVNSIAVKVIPPSETFSLICLHGSVSMASVVSDSETDSDEACFFLFDDKKSTSLGSIERKNIYSKSTLLTGFRHFCLSILA